MISEPLKYYHIAVNSLGTYVIVRISYYSLYIVSSLGVVSQFTVVSTKSLKLQSLIYLHFCTLQTLKLRYSMYMLYGVFSYALYHHLLGWYIYFYFSLITPYTKECMKMNNLQEALFYTDAVILFLLNYAIICNALPMFTCMIYISLYTSGTINNRNIDNMILVHFVFIVILGASLAIMYIKSLQLRKPLFNLVCMNFIYSYIRIFPYDCF